MTTTYHPADTFITAAFDELLSDVSGLLVSAQAQKPQDRDEVMFWKAQANALNKAQYQWSQGVRPAQSGPTWLMPSASRPGALIHRLTKQGGIVVCSCEAGQRGLLCWHHMLINVLERAAELESLATAVAVGSGPDAAPATAAALLEARLIATAAIIDAMRAAQGRGPLASVPPDTEPGEDLPNDIPPTSPGRLPFPPAVFQRIAAARRTCCVAL